MGFATFLALLLFAVTGVILFWRFALDQKAQKNSLDKTKPKKDTSSQLPQATRVRNALSNNPLTEQKSTNPKQIDPAQSPSVPSTTTDSSALGKTEPALNPMQTWSNGLKKSREPFLVRLRLAISELTSNQPWNDQHPLWERLEEALLGADLGPTLTERLLQSLRTQLHDAPTEEKLRTLLHKQMEEILDLVPSANATLAIQNGSRPQVTVLIGVNGAGKTTTAGKLASQALVHGRTVIVGAGDTFRAAAVEQLKTWADRLNIECVVPAQGANPAAVAFDTVAAGLARQVDEVILDTAGRLHTKDNLMEELRKIARVIDKKIPGAPHLVYLVIDATLGQNAVVQAREFSAAMKPTGIILTKMDGSAKGGAAFAIATELGIPISYIGLGETAADLKPFHANEFVENLL